MVGCGCCRKIQRVWAQDLSYCPSLGAIFLAELDLKLVAVEEGSGLTARIIPSVA
jgi:hypothetical protein